MPRRLAPPYGEYAEAFWFTVDVSVDGLCGMAGVDAEDSAVVGSGIDGAADCGITGAIVSAVARVNWCSDGKLGKLGGGIG